MMFDEMSRCLTVMHSFLYVTEVIRDHLSKVCTVSNTLKLTFYTCDKLYDISRFTCNAFFFCSAECEVCIVGITARVIFHVSRPCSFHSEKNYLLRTTSEKFKQKRNLYSLLVRCVFMKLSSLTSKDRLLFNVFSC